jgi:hypothetical protein
MTDKIHIYIYYNILYQKYLGYDDNYEKIMITELTIITDEKIVKEILKNPTSEINDYGEFNNWDDKLIKNIVLTDINNYKEKNKFGINWDFNIDSFYYIKCELKKDIHNEISNFLYSI